MREITRSDIKDISFGPNDTWAIVMENGHCHGSLQSGPLAAVNEHQGKISYVALTDKTDEYIVGWGRNGYSYKGLSESITNKIQELNRNNTEIHRVQLGKHGARGLIHHDGGWFWSGLTDEFSSAFKESDARDAWFW